MGENGILMKELFDRMANVEPLPDEPDFFRSAETLARFLKARDWKINDAEKLLKAAVEWRRVYRPLHGDCKWCHETPGYHCMRQVGFDVQGRAVIYSCFAQAAIHRNTVEDSVAHIVYLIENAKLTMPPGVNAWVWVLDCTGMTVPACNPKLGYGTSQIFSNHYPERLGLAICINHNPVFQGIWRAIKVFLHPNTVAKVQIHRSKKKIDELFHRHFPDDLREWLEDEIRLNKQSPISKSQLEFWKGPDDTKVHDPRGSPEYLDKFVKTNDSPIKPLEKDGRRHRAHPNILDALAGKISEARAGSYDEDRLRELASVNHMTDSIGDPETEGQAAASKMAELAISEEYQISPGSSDKKT